MGKKIKNDVVKVVDIDNSLDAGGVDGGLAGIEYVGIPGGSKDCQDAVIRFVQSGDRVTHARIISCENHHCLLLTINVGDLVAVKSGFASGYGGEGPRRFSYVLRVLETHGAEIEEYIAAEELLDRIDRSALTRSDLEMLDKATPRRPTEWHDYISDDHYEKNKKGTLLSWEFPVVVPFAIIDSRIVDLAISFWEGPDDKLLVGYRRLEDRIRERTGIKEHGAKLFSQAFNPSGGPLTWKSADDAECVGRMNLFTGTYMAHRNRRAHRELSEGNDELLSELLLLNHLYRLESDSVTNESRQS